MLLTIPRAAGTWVPPGGRAERKAPAGACVDGPGYELLGTAHGEGHQFRVINIGEPAAMTVESSLTFENTVRDVQVVGTHAYVRSVVVWPGVRYPG